MGAIARNAANNITTGGVFTSGAITNASVTGITVLANVSDGITLISSQTASNSASISFTTGLDSTYKAYKFVWINIHPRTDSIDYTFNLSTDSGSNYNVSKTTTYFYGAHDEADTSALIAYEGSGNWDLANSTGEQFIASSLGNGADESCSGSLTLFNPSSTTYVKHFISTSNWYRTDNHTFNSFTSGYGNTTSAINAIRFKASSGNIDGTFYLYGIK
jgi:hypothetical protein